MGRKRHIPAGAAARTVILINIIAVLASAAVAVKAADVSGVMLFPADIYIEPGEACTLQVLVDDAVDSLSCMEVRLCFDSSVLDIVKGLEGGLYSSAPFSTFFDWEEESPDTALAVDCVLGYRSYVLAPGELTSFVFEAVHEGSAEVRICRVKLWDIDRNELEVEIGTQTVVHVSTLSGGGPVPAGGAALYNYPNPFNPSTTIWLDVPGPEGEKDVMQEVELSIFDPAGRSIASLFSGTLSPGGYTFRWDGRSAPGGQAVSGIYFARAKIGQQTLKRKLVLLR